MRTAPLTEFATPERNSIVDGPFGSDLKASEYAEAGVPIIRLQNIRPNEFLHKDIKYITPVKASELRRHSYKPGDIVITKLGDPCGVACMVPETAGEGVIVADVVRVRPDLNEVDPHYLVHAWNSPVVRRQIEAQTRGTTRPRVNLSLLKAVQCPKPPLPEQRRIADILDRADALKRKRQQALKLGDDFLRATFLDMFGDPATNPKGWPIVQISVLLDESRGGTRCGPFGSALKRHEYIDEGVPVWGIDNVSPNRFEEAGSLFISESKFIQLKGYRVRAGDVLISRAGTVGRMCVANPSTPNSIIGTNLIRVSLDSSKLDPHIFTTLFTLFADRLGKLRANGKADAYSFMKTGVLRTMAIPVPEPRVQKEYLEVVNKIEVIYQQCDEWRLIASEAGSVMTATLLGGHQRS